MGLRGMYMQGCLCLTGRFICVYSSFITYMHMIGWYTFSDYGICLNILIWFDEDWLIAWGYSFFYLIIIMFFKLLSKSHTLRLCWISDLAHTERILGIWTTVKGFINIKIKVHFWRWWCRWHFHILESKRKFNQFEGWKMHEFKQKILHNFSLSVCLNCVIAVGTRLSNTSLMTRTASFRTRYGFYINEDIASSLKSFEQFISVLFHLFTYTLRLWLTTICVHNDDVICK